MIPSAYRPLRRLTRAATLTLMVFGSAILGLATKLHAQHQEFEMTLPVICVLDDTCFFQQYVDHDPGPEAVDFTCGGASYDGHNGTDIRVATMADLADGIPITAAQSGEVTALRDGMADHIVRTEADFEAISGRECGNGVVVNHGDGWETQYCHMKNGSVVVTQGQEVQQGQILGLMGASGKTQFPHLHITLRRNGEVVDPFRPDATSCGYDPKTDLWLNAAIGSFDAVPGEILKTGFSDKPVELAPLIDGTIPGFAGDPAAPMVIYALMSNVLKGDFIVFRIKGPEGEVLSKRSKPLPKRKAQLMRFIGKKAPGGGWAPGTYHAQVTLERAGKIVDEVKFSVDL